MFLQQDVLRVTVHTRGCSPNACTLTVEGVLAALREQNWGSAPLDLIQASNEARVWAAGTFINGFVPGGAIREWFITDGICLANFGLTGTPGDILLATPVCEQMVRSLRFDPGRGSSGRG